MANVYNVDEKMRKMRAKLYPSYLPGTEGSYVARTANEVTADVGNICASMVNRSTYTGGYEEAMQTLRHFFLEVKYKLADGSSVDLDICTIYPHIGGLFKDDKEAYDRKKHPLSFRIQLRKALRDLRNEMGVIIEGYADISGSITAYVDVEEDSENSIFTPGDQFIITGDKIKVAGDDPSCGVYMVPVDDPASALKLTRIAENSPGKIIGVMHQSTGHGLNRLEIRTQFTGSAAMLKTPRVITSGFVLEEN